MDNPKEEYLYHGSPDREIKVLEIRAESYRDKEEGPLVFATKYKDYAAMFLVLSDDTWTMKTRLNGIFYNIIGDKERYLSLDKGGAIYTLPSASFYIDPKRGMKGDVEWVSKTSVEPISVEYFDNSLDAMRKYGTKIYFVSPTKFQNYLAMETKIEVFEDLFKNEKAFI